MQTYTTFGQNGPYWIFGNCALAEDGSIIVPDEKHIFTDTHFHPGFQFQLVSGSQDYEPRMPHTMPWTRAQENMAGGMFTALAFALSGMYGQHGLTALGHACSYAVADYCIEHYAHHPGLWIHGSMCAGKTTLAQFLCWMWGHAPRYRGCRIDVHASREEPAAGPEPHPPSHTNFNALARILAQFTNLPVLFDEYRFASLSTGLDDILRAACSRTHSLNPGNLLGLQTSPIIVGEKTSTDLATVSRFIHLPLYQHLLPKEQGRAQAYSEAVKIKHSLRFLGFALLKNRSLLLAHFQSQMDEWQKDAAVLQAMPLDRVRLNYGIAFCALASAVAVLCKRFNLWPDCIPHLYAYRSWIIQHIAEHERRF